MSDLFVILGVALLLALLGLWQSLRVNAGRGARVPADRNPAFFRQRLAELEQDRDSGDLDQETFDQLQLELQRQLLSESHRSGSELSAGNHRLPQYVLLGGALMVLSGLLYWQVGAWPDLRFNRLQDEFASKSQFTEQDRERLQEAIATSLRHGDNPTLRFWQAQLAIEQGDFDRAVSSYRKLLAQRPEDATVMAQLAQALFLQNDRQLTAEARELMRRASARDPHQTTALGMLGIDAFERGDYQAAIDHWSTLLRGIDPRSERASVIQHALDRAKALAEEQGLIEGIEVVVHAGDQPLPEQGVLYVFAKAAEGPGFPLAVVRRPQTQAEWPQTVMLTPADAMRPEMSLENFEQVRLTARLSKSGSVSASSGDVEGSSEVIAWREHDGAVSITLDNRIP